MRYLKEYGAQLVALGYSIIPLPPGTKGPRKPGWQKITATPELVDAWLANGSADDGIGVLAAHTPAIDVDIMDAQVAEEVRRLLERHFGPVLHTRVGMAPKFLVPFRCATPFKKLSSHYYTDTVTDIDHHVEILAEGQQWVAYHEHPDTHQPYTWPRGNLLDLPYAELPLLSESAAAAFVAGFEAIASRLVDAGQWEKKVRVADTPTTPKPSDDPLLTWKPTIDFKTLKSALAKIPNKGKDELDYDAWRNIIFAIHRETQGADHGRQLAHAWSARSSKHDAAFLDERVWPYIHSDRPGAVTGLTIIKLARGYGWESAAPAKIDRLPAKLLQLSDFAQLKPVSWLIKSILPAAEVAICYGASGSGKSFFVLDMAAAVARGIEWRGHRTRQCPVVYVAAEGAGGFRGRTVAYGRHNHLDLATVPFYVLPSIIDLADDYPQLITNIDEIGGAGLVVVDTLAATTPGMDENTGKDMGRVIDACRQIHDATGAMVLLIHHSGKDAAQGARGWSGLRAACDAEFQITQEGDTRAARVTKQKDGEEGQEYGFKLQVVEIGEDEDGDPITSCVVTAADVVKATPRVKLSDAQQFILDVFDQALGMDDSLTEVELIDAVKAAQKEYGDTPSRASNIKRSIERIVEYGILDTSTGKILRA